MATNPFIGHYLPDLFWPAQLQVFGVEVTYIPKSDATLAANVTVLWKEGQSDEEVSPGRYSHMDVENAALPAPPVLGDFVQNNGRRYQVTRIEALAIGFSVLVLQEIGAAV
jgi:hypothetical protein